MVDKHNEPFGDREPPAALERRIANSMRAAGMLEPRRSPRRRQLLAAAAVLAAIAASFQLGRMQRAPLDLRDAYVLLLYEGATYRDDRPLREIVREYAAWADSLDRRGALVLAEKLSDERTDLAMRPTASGSAGSDEAPTGMFIVRASNLSQARAIAASSPHLRHGGRIHLRAIDR